MKSLVHKSAWFLAALSLATAIEIGILETSSAVVPTHPSPGDSLWDNILLSTRAIAESSTPEPASIESSPPIISPTTDSRFPPHSKKVIFYPLKHSFFNSFFPSCCSETENRESQQFGFARDEKAEAPIAIAQLSDSALSPAQKLLRSPASPFQWQPKLYTNSINLNTIAQSPDALPTTPEPNGEPPSLRLVPGGDYQVPPSISVAMPFAYGLFWRSVGIGLGVQSRTRYTNQADGGLGMSIGLGNPQNSVGFDIGISIFDLSDFASRGSFSFKIHRTLPDRWAVAVGVQNAIVWGYTDAGTSVYGVASKTFRLQESIDKPLSLLVISGGIGSGQFRSESDIKNEIESVGAFGSVALRVVEPVNAIAEWTGQDLTLGLSYIPLQNTPLVLTGALTDLTGNAGDGTRFILRVGYIFSF